MSDTQRATIRTALLRAHDRMAMLRALAHLDLPDAWIAAGAVRNAVWDALQTRRRTEGWNIGSANCCPARHGP